jgi:hypothetical protein
MMSSLRIAFETFFEDVDDGMTAIFRKSHDVEFLDRLRLSREPYTRLGQDPVFAKH